MINAELNPLSGDYAAPNRSVNHLMHAVYVRLVTPLGGWWADVHLGSRLFELRREKDVPRVRVLAKQFAEDALRPLLVDGRAKSVVVAVLDEALHLPLPRVCLRIEVVDGSDRRHVFSHFVEVGA